MIIDANQTTTSHHELQDPGTYLIVSPEGWQYRSISVFSYVGVGEY